MTTIKSYTDLEQSKKLIEILLLESADMHHVLIDTENELYSAGLGEYIGILPHYPCWSLSALLNVLPKINGVSLKIEKIKAEDGYDGYYYSIEYEGIVLIPYSKNPVDACYEMILKLHKLNLL